MLIKFIKSFARGLRGRIAMRPYKLRYSRTHKTYHPAYGTHPLFAPPLSGENNLLEGGEFTSLLVASH